MWPIHAGPSGQTLGGERKENKQKSAARCKERMKQSAGVTSRPCWNSVGISGDASDPRAQGKVRTTGDAEERCVQLLLRAYDGPRPSEPRSHLSLTPSP